MTSVETLGYSLSSLRDSECPEGDILKIARRFNAGNKMATRPSVVSQKFFY